MDPFEGSDGVRANINGHKCVMDGNPGEKYVQYDAENHTLSVSVSMWQGYDNSRFRLVLTVQDAAPLTTGVRYHVSLKGSTTATLTGMSDSPNEAVSLVGWIEFLQLGADQEIVEAEFEMTGTAPKSNVDYDVRHGFLRLYKEL